MIICEPIDEAALIHISQSRSLESFTSDLGTYRPDDLKRIVTGLGSPDQPPFENLRVLDLLVEDLSCIIPILRPHHQPFTAVFIDCQPTLTPGVLPELLTALSSLPRRSSLQQLRLASPGGSEPITFQALLPLLSFNRLKVFDFDLANPIVMDDEELAQLAGAWPELETFHLNKLAGWSAEINTKLPTSKGFSTLLALCPKLCDLFLCVDMRDVSSSSMGEYPGEESRNTSLTTLMLVESPIEEPVSKVTEFLIKHAPSLTDLSVWSNEFLHEERYHTHYEPLWEKVRGQIREIKGLD